MKIRNILTTTLLLLTVATAATARGEAPSHNYRDSVMALVFRYAQRIDTTGIHRQSAYTYTKFQMDSHRRNALLMLVPTMYAVAHGAGRTFISEYYNKSLFDSQSSYRRLLTTSTIPHRRNTMTSMLKYLTPSIYGESLFQDNILSPFHPSNRRYYTYAVTPLPYGKAQIYVYPRIKNTQTVEAKALVDDHTGRIILADFEGEYDMTRFYISLVMGAGGYHSLYPIQCDLKANFRCLGNKITGMYTTYYNLPKLISDSLDNDADTALMSRVRPVPLNKREQAIYDKFYQAKNQRDSINSTREPRKDFVKDVLWDVVGDNVLNRIYKDLGKEKQGYFRISPILNPLYMEYTQRKGFVYKFDIRGSYAFSDDVQVALRFRSGYSFKQRRFYFYIPATINYNSRHNGYLQIEIGNGNHINNNMVARRILGISDRRDSIIWMPTGQQYRANIEELGISEFKDTYIRATNHWNFTPRMGMELGVVGHHRQAVFPDFYSKNGYPTSYRSIAPALALVWQPIGSKGPILKADYERSIKGFCNSNIDYERIELDAQSILHASRRRLFSLRLGAGFYTMKGDHWDFVDYTNFSDNNIPGGWNDDWSGHFELLNTEWYNASDYYVRSNATYEAPILFAAWLPVAGRFVEKERIYVNTLLVNHLHPYTEWGYGFSSRLLSMGIFAAFRNTSYYGVGFKFGFELFRNW